MWNRYRIRKGCGIRFLSLVAKKKSLLLYIYYDKYLIGISIIGRIIIIIIHIVFAYDITSCLVRVKKLLKKKIKTYFFFFVFSYYFCEFQITHIDARLHTRI